MGVVLLPHHKAMYPTSDDTPHDALPPDAPQGPPKAAELFAFPRDRAAVLRRARSTEVIGLRYGYGAGAVVRASATLKRGQRLDCSEWAMWVLGIDKLTRERLIVRFNGGWFNSNALVFDATNPGGLFTQTHTPQPGDLIVYGQTSRYKGHVGIVETVVNGKVTSVIECSSYHDRLTGNAIGRRPPDHWYGRGAIVVRPDWL